MALPPFDIELVLYAVTVPLVSGDIDSLVANMVGTDISPRWDLEDNTQKEEIQDVWSFSLEETDYYGVFNFTACRGKLQWP